MLSETIILKKKKKRWKASPAPNIPQHANHQTTTQTSQRADTIYTPLQNKAPGHPPKNHKRKYPATDPQHTQQPRPHIAANKWNPLVGQEHLRRLLERIYSRGSIQASLLPANAGSRARPAYRGPPPGTASTALTLVQQPSILHTPLSRTKS